MASRRRRRKSIGKVIVDVERRVRRVEKRPGAKRLKTNVVTTEKLGFRAVNTKAVQPDAITPNEAAFGTTVVTDTQPTQYLKEGTTWVDPNTGSTQVYDTATSTFIEVTDATARASADGKNTIYRQNSQPTGGTYVTGDTWFDSDDNNKIYRYDGTNWVAVQLGGNGLANINANSITAGTIDASLITVSNLDAGNITTGTLDAIKITSGGLTINADGSITTSSGNFGVSAGGVVTATGVDISGEINASSGTFSGTITATGTISGGTISGATITGGAIKTATSGQRIELSSSSANNIFFYDASSTNYGVISVTDYALYVYGPGSALGNGARMQLYSDQNPLSSLAGLAAIQAGGTGDVTFATNTNLLRIDGATTTVSLNASTPIGTYGLRNIRGFTSFDPATNSSGVDGDIAVVYT